MRKRPAQELVGIAAAGESLYRLLQVLRKTENHLCADCSSPLVVSNINSYSALPPHGKTYKKIDNNSSGNSSSLSSAVDSKISDGAAVFASMAFRVWICSLCAESHRAVVKTSKLKQLSEVWSEDEIHHIESASSNVKMNKVYERYIPHSWHKIDKLTSSSGRNHWIRAKYSSGLFMIPPPPFTNTDANFYPSYTEANKESATFYSNPMTESAPVASSTVLPPRIVDYFITIGIGMEHSTYRVSTSSLTKCNEESFNIADVYFNPAVSNCYPDFNHHADTPIPELLGQLVFPMGLTLSPVEKQPFFFSFVLTDVSRVKLYGTVLIVYELVDLRKLAAVAASAAAASRKGQVSEKTLQGEEFLAEKLASLSKNTVLYAPKALATLSHYGFFHLYALFLQQIYHVSLSSSPIPIERYIANFAVELPLPPQGKTEIFYTLPEFSVQITRPPKNQLPMVDFSYRPLFTCLSVDNILTVFSLLCAEATVCICASNLSLLTPVQEALLSFLFPFVWQGCYVPVLPLHMIELLEAPVPLLVGLSDSYLINTPPQKRPKSVAFVHLDENKIFFEETEDHLLEKVAIHPLPAKPLAKLKKKLMEFGGCIFRHPDEVGLLSTAGYPFANNEHLKPISSFTSEHGVYMNVKPIGHTSASKSNLKTGIRPEKYQNMNGSSNDGKTSGAASIVACTTVTVGSPMTSILDPANNKPSVGKDTFDANEIRDAFFRFFVASFSDYQDYFVYTSTCLSTCCASVGNAPAATPAAVAAQAAATKGSGKSAPTHTASGASEPARDTTAEGKTEEQITFNFDAYQAHVQDPFLRQMIGTQMFSNYISERLEAPDQVEIKYFDENIIAKSNRSILSLKKNTTPFLSDESDVISESFTVPLPSNSGLPTDRVYTYTSFPYFDKKLVGNIRNAQVLIHSVEIKRLHGKAVAEQIKMSKVKGAMSFVGPVTSSASTGTGGSSLRSRKLSIADMKLAFKGFSSKSSFTRSVGSTSGSVDLSMNDSNSVGPSLSIDAHGGAPSQYDGSASGGGLSENGVHLTASPSDIDAYLSSAEKRFNKVIHEIVVVQNRWRMFPCKRLFVKKLSFVQKIQRFIRIVLLKLTLTKRIIHKRMLKRLKNIILLQSVYRMHVARKEFKLVQWMAVTFQSYFRSRKQRAVFLRLRRRVVAFQGVVRGTLTRVRTMANMERNYNRCREQCLYLWALEQTSYSYRSMFWIMVDKPSFMNTALYEEELLRLYDALNLLRSGPRRASSFQEKFDFVSSHTMDPLAQRYRGSSSAVEKAALLREFDAQINGANTAKTHTKSDTTERTSLYMMLKDNKLHPTSSSTSTSTTNDSLFDFFGLQDKKKRKQKLADAVWTDLSSTAHVDLSAQVVLRITCISNEYKLEWVRAIKRNRLQKDCLDTVRACILSIQRQHDRKKPSQMKIK